MLVYDTWRAAYRAVCAAVARIQFGFCSFCGFFPLLLDDVETTLSSLVHVLLGVGELVVVIWSDGALPLIVFQAGAGLAVLVLCVGTAAGGGCESCPRPDPNQKIIS